MDTSATQDQPPVDAEAIAGQQEHWAATFDANPDMYGTDPSAPGLAAAKAFAAAGHSSVLELGAGQGRDTFYLARQGLHVMALDHAPGTVETLSAKTQAAGLADMVSVARHDMREPLPLPDASIDASYSHMLFCMALTTGELERLAAELRRCCAPEDWLPTPPAPPPTLTKTLARPAVTTCTNTEGSSSTSSTGRSSTASARASSSSTSPTSPRQTCPAASPESPWGSHSDSSVPDRRPGCPLSRAGCRRPLRHSSCLAWPDPTHQQVSRAVAFPGRAEGQEPPIVMGPPMFCQAPILPARS